MPILLMVLAVLWAVLLFGGFVFGKPDPVRRMPVWTRLSSSLVLVVAAWCWLLLSPEAIRPFAWWLAIGMTLGFVGDIFMAKEVVIGGMGSFGLGHVAYIIGMIWLGNAVVMVADGARWGAWLVWLLIGAVGWYVVVFRGHEVTLMHKLALPYALLLASTAGVATGLALQSSLFVPMAVGAALFLLSDLVIAAQLFNGVKFRAIGDVIWLTYGPGQMLIIYAVYAAWQLV